MGCLCPGNQFQNPDKLDPGYNTGRGVSIQSFKKVKVIGKGNFGTVFLVEKIGTQEYFAMKVLKKDFIKMRNQKEHTVNERKILGQSDCPFIAKLCYAFQDKRKLYIIMEYLNGGELFFHLSQQGVFSEMRAKFYLSEIVLGLEYLHREGVIYRDLKPENILLDSEGHIRLTDFGLSKMDMNDQRTKTFCGTPEYLAPEVLKHESYDKSVDLWSLGAVMYFMLSGAPPHYSHNKAEIFKNILTRPIEPILSATNAANDLVLGLLKIDPKERIPEIQAVKAHEWFDGINWEDVYLMKPEPPYKPKVKSVKDVNNFDKAFTSAQVDTVESLEISGPATHYSGFTYKEASVSNLTRTNSNKTNK